jgi:copper resistance protein D
VHGASRLEGAAALMAITVAHQVGAAMWAGGLVHLLGQRLLVGRDPSAARAWPALVARFSPVAASGVALIAATGLVLSWRYIGSVSALVGTAYGAMVATKVALMGAALLLGAGNYLAVRRWRRRGGGAVEERVPMVEAEAGAVVVILLAAAALTSQPPAVDLVSERATLGEVAATLAPKRPRLVPPPYREMVAASQSSLDLYLQPGPLDRAQSTFNHDAAGVLVLITAIGALIDRSGKVRAARHWPLAFLGLAAFLVIIGEPNGWPFGPEGLFETLVAPAVLLHRLSTVLVIVLALLEWRVRVGGLATTRWRFAFPLLCAGGGALLLTHSHSVSAVKWAYLIEVSHNAIGVLAVVVGMARWLELRAPTPERRAYGFVWTTCMVLIGVVLLFYRE